MTGRTYGRLLHGKHMGSVSWAVDQIDGGIATRVKAVFPGSQKGRSRAVVLADTAERVRDLRWLMDRWPMQMDDTVAAQWQKRCAEVDALAEHVEAALTGRVRTDTVDGYRPPVIAARQYQQIAADLAAATGHLLCTDELGLGKTFTALLPLCDPTMLPALLVVDTHLPGQWEKQCVKFMPWLTTHVLRNGPMYDPATRMPDGQFPDAVIMSYSKLAKWVDKLAGVFRYVAFDEVQELRRDGTDKYLAAQSYARTAVCRVGVSNTPIYNYGDEMYTVMHVLAPGALGTRDEFHTEWCHRPGQHWMVKDPKALGDYLREQGLMLGRTRQQVGRELPPMIREQVTIDHDAKLLADEQDAVEGLARALLAPGSTRFERFQAAGNLDWRLRRATGVAKAPFVAAFVNMILQSERKVLLVGWHRDVYDLWLAALAQHQPVMYTGSESPAAKTRNLNRFLTDPDCRVMMLSLRSGKGIDGLQDVCRVVVHGELDWSSEVHRQVDGRLHRDGLDVNDPPVAFYLLANDGSDPVIAEVLQVKDWQTVPMVNPHRMPDGDDPPPPTDEQTESRARMLARKVMGTR